MTIQEINTKLQSMVQKPHSESETFRQYLEGIFEEYIQMLADSRADLEQYAINTHPFEYTLGAVEESCKRILTAYDLYMEGKIEEAISVIRVPYMAIGTAYRKEVTAANVMYRATIESAQGSFNTKEMFHVPFEKRGIISNERYSIAGYPCLYTGKSILTCWEEMHKPNIDNLCVSRLTLKKGKSYHVIDLCWRENFEEKYEGNVLSRVQLYLENLPLVIACSIKVFAPKAHFKEEYVIPQLLLQACINNELVDGIAFTSTRRDAQICGDIELHKNYVFPVRKVSDRGYCEKLSNDIVMTNGVSFMEADIKNVFHGRGIPTIEIEGETLSFSEVDEGKSEYECTKFGQMEEYLGKQKFYTLVKRDGEWEMKPESTEECR